MVATRKAVDVGVIKEILRYFLHNPGAVDSLAGIARWRLMQETVRRSVEDTQVALNWLLAEGYVREEARAGTASLFVLNAVRRADAESLIAESGSADSQWSEKTSD